MKLSIEGDTLKVEFDDGETLRCHTSKLEVPLRAIRSVIARPPEVRERLFTDAISSAGSFAFQGKCYTVNGLQFWVTESQKPFLDIELKGVAYYLYSMIVLTLEDAYEWADTINETIGKAETPDTYGSGRSGKSGYLKKNPLELTGEEWDEIVRQSFDINSP